MIKNKRWVNYILLGIGLVIFILFIVTTDFSEIKKSIGYLNIRILIVLIILVMLTIVIRGYRWKALIKILTKKNISMKLAMTSMVAGVAAGTLTPGRGFEIAKPLILKGTHDIPINKSISAMIIEKVFDMIGYIFVFFLAMFLIPRGIQNKIIITGVIIVFAIIILVFISPKILSKIFDFILRKIYLPKILKKKAIEFNNILFTSFSEVKGKNILWIGSISIGELFLEVFIFYFILTILNIKINFFITAFAFTGAVLFSLITMIPGGIGVNEISQAGIISSIEPTLRSNMGVIKTGILIDVIVTYYILVILGVIILLLFKKFTEKKKIKI